MIVGVEARLAMARGRGWQRYAMQFLAAAASLDRVQFRAVVPDTGFCREFASKFETIDWVFKEFGFSQRRDYTFASLDAEDGFADAADIDVYHSLTRFVTNTRIRPVIATVHDIAPLSVPPYKLEVRDSTLAAVNRLLEYDSVIVAISNYTREELLQHTHIQEDRIRVVSPGVDSFNSASVQTSGAQSESEFPARRPGQPVVLYLGGAGENKNLGRLIQAALLEKQVQLWLSGDPGWGYDGIREQIDSARDAGLAVSLLGMVPDERIPALFSHADAFVMPSLHEGFGLPLVEAMSMGVPVCCSDIPVFREVAGKAALYFDPLDVHSIQRSLQECFNNRFARTKKIELGHAKSRNFRWRAHVEAVTDLYFEENERKTADAPVFRLAKSGRSGYAG